MNKDDPDSFHVRKYQVILGLTKSSLEWARVADAFFPGNDLTKAIRNNRKIWEQHDAMQKGGV
jgi:hypothetical protein